MIDDLTDQEKSVLLARAMGWEVFDHEDYGEPLMIPPDGIPKWMGENVLAIADLYDPANMALAWRVLNWAYNILPPVQWRKFNMWWKTYRDDDNKLIWGSPDAQRAWLDRILELAIEAGIVEVDGE